MLVAHNRNVSAMPLFVSVVLVIDAHKAAMNCLPALLIYNSKQLMVILNSGKYVMLRVNVPFILVFHMFSFLLY